MLQFSDVISLISLLVGIVAIMVLPVGYYLDKANRTVVEAQASLIAAMHELKVHSKVLEETVGSMSDVAQRMHSKAQFLAGIGEQLLERQGVDRQRVEAYRRSISRYDEQISRPLNDLLIFSGDEKSRLSAHIKAADSLGGLSSLRKMKLCAERYPSAEPSFGKCTSDLEQRLDRG